MKSNNLSNLLLTGLLLSLAASFCMQIFTFKFNTEAAFNLTLVINVSLYMIVTIINSPHKRGLLLVALYLSTHLAGLSYFELSSQFFLISSLIFIFIMRVLHAQKRLLQAIYSALLIVVGFIIASIVLVNTNSWLLSFWCFYLSQAIQQPLLNYLSDNQKHCLTNDNINSQKFNQANNRAEQLIQKLLTQ